MSAGVAPSDRPNKGLKNAPERNQGQAPDLQVEDFIRPSIFDKYSGSMKVTAHLDHVSRCKTASGTTWSDRWTH